MIILCPPKCDHGIPFPHTTIVTERLTRDERIVTTLFVCRVCGHWIERPLTERCRCRASCHSEVRYGLSEGIMVVRTPRKG